MVVDPERCRLTFAPWLTVPRRLRNRVHRRHKCAGAKWPNLRRRPSKRVYVAARTCLSLLLDALVVRVAPQVLVEYLLCTDLFVAAPGCCHSSLTRGDSCPFTICSGSGHTSEPANWPGAIGRFSSLIRNETLSSLTIVLDCSRLPARSVNRLVTVSV